MPHNALSYALFILNFLNMDVHEQFAADRFWHDGIKTIFAKKGGETLAVDYGKDQILC